MELNLRVALDMHRNRGGLSCSSRRFQPPHRGVPLSPIVATWQHFAKLQTVEFALFLLFLLVALGLLIVAPLHKFVQVFSSTSIRYQHTCLLHLAYW